MYFKENWQSMAEKEPALGHVGIFQTSPRGTAPTLVKMSGLFQKGKRERRRVYFPPVVAMPSMNWRWKIRYRITMGSMASSEPAISTGKLVVN